MAKKPPAARVRLRPQNAFDLIRLLARSQSDPRKAVAELVQNSLDAGARRIELTWLNEKGRRVLRIHDPEVQHRVHLHRYVVARDHVLRRHV